MQKLGNIIYQIFLKLIKIALERFDYYFFAKVFLSKVC